MLHLSRYRVNRLWEHPGLLYEELDKLLNELEDDFHWRYGSPVTVIQAHIDEMTLGRWIEWAYEAPERSHSVLWVLSEEDTETVYREIRRLFDANPRTVQEFTHIMRRFQFGRDVEIMPHRSHVLPTYDGDPPPIIDSIELVRLPVTVQDDRDLF